jgi:hypothetical protein
MTELTPRVQNLLKKLLAEFETEDLPVEITLQTSGIQVATAKRSYQMRSHRPRTTREPMGDVVKRHLDRYKRDIISAKPIKYSLPDFEGTIEAKLVFYLSNYELGQTQKKTSLQLESLAGIGTVIQPYLEEQKEMTALRKVIAQQGHHASTITRMAKRTLELVHARGPEMMRDYQSLTPWTIYRAKDAEWEVLLNTATLQSILEKSISLDSQELIFEDPVMLPDS